MSIVSREECAANPFVDTSHGNSRNLIGMDEKCRLDATVADARSDRDRFSRSFLGDHLGRDSGLPFLAMFAIFITERHYASTLRLWQLALVLKNSSSFFYLALDTRALYDYRACCAARLH